MGKEVVFHPYALYKMGGREISKAKVEETIKQPHSIMKGKFGRKIAQRRYGDHLLRVVFEEYENCVLVITAYPARAERYLRG